MPPELTPWLPWIACASISALLAWLLTFLGSSLRRARLEEQLKAAERENISLDARLAAAESHADESDRYAHALANQLAEVRTRLEQEKRSAAERQALLENAERRLSDNFRALSSEALRASSEQFMHLARASLRAQNEEAKGDLEQRRMAIEHLVRPVAESLGKFEERIGEIEKIREGAYAELRTQVSQLAEGQSGLQRETSQLVRALRQPAGRGQWGEMQLRRVVELAGMQEHCDFQVQPVTSDSEGRIFRPDLIVRLPAGRTIVVDAKTPMDGYLDALEATGDAQREEALQRHVRQLRTHITQLASKNYAAQFQDAPEFTVLFLPSESFFSAALHTDTALIERGVERGVILATPTTLIALLRAVACGWRQEALAANSREIFLLARTLHERLSTLAGHFGRLGRSLEGAVGHYNAAIASYESRVLTTARKFEDLQAADGTLPDLPAVDSSPRQPAAVVAAADQVVGFDSLSGSRDQALSAAADLRSALEG